MVFWPDLAMRQNRGWQLKTYECFAGETLKSDDVVVKSLNIKKSCFAK